MNVLKTTYTSNNLQSILGAAAFLAGADKIYVIGNGISESPTHFCVSRLSHLGKPAEFVDVNVEQSIINCLANRSNRSVFIVISFPLYSVNTLALVDYLAKKNLRYLSASDRHSCEIAYHAAISLI